ncbi:MAG: TolC family protein [Terriglobales bacterium]
MSNKALFQAISMLLLVPLMVEASSQPPKAAEPAQIQGQTLTGELPVTLESLIDVALQKNPGIQSSLRMVEARRRRIPQAKALPDPTLTFGWAGDPVPFKVQRGDPSSYRSFQAMQEIPLGGKRGLRAEIAEKESDAAWWEYEDARRRLVADVKTAYYDYVYYQKALEITRKNQDLLQKLAKIAEARYQVGKGMQADVLRSHVELSRLRQRITVLEQQKRTAQARINTLLFRDPETPLPRPAGFESARLERGLDELYKLARENDTELQRQRQLIERGQTAVQLARKEYVPDLAVGYMFQNRPGMPEMHGATFSFNIPIFYKSKQQEMVKEAQLELASTERGRDDRLTKLNFELKEQYLMAKASEELVELFEQGVVPQSSLALESSMAAYQVGTVDFLTVITNFTTVLDYEVEYYRERSNLQMALARLEPLVGVELTK